MQLYVPTIGVKLKLTKDWTFGLLHHHLNMKLGNKLDMKIDSMDGRWWGNRRNPGPKVVTVPTGTILTVDRIYIRSGRGKGAFDSITFKTGKGDSPDPNFCQVRFFARLEECNQIEFEIEAAKGFAVQESEGRLPPLQQYGG